MGRVFGAERTLPHCPQNRVRTRCTPYVMRSVCPHLASLSPMPPVLRPHWPPSNTQDVLLSHFGPWTCFPLCNPLHVVFPPFFTLLTFLLLAVSAKMLCPKGGFPEPYPTPPALGWLSYPIMTPETPCTSVLGACLPPAMIYFMTSPCLDCKLHQSRENVCLGQVPAPCTQEALNKRLGSPREP